MKRLLINCSFRYYFDHLNTVSKTHYAVIVSVPNDTTDKNLETYVLEELAKVFQKPFNLEFTAQPF
jgi:hypothetical protein